MMEPWAEEYQALDLRVSALLSDPKLLEENGDPEFCRSLVRKLGDAGLLVQFLSPTPQVRRLCFLRYRLARLSALSDLLFTMQGLGSFPVAIAGNDDQKNKYLSKVASGEAVAAFAMTEPEAGSDAASMKLSAVRKGDGYVLNGVKRFISNAGIADFYSIFTRTSEGSKGITALILDSNTAGLEIRTTDLIGTHPIGELHLKDCFVSAKQRLGDEGSGLKIAYGTLDVFRSSVGAAAIGMAQRAFEEAIRYAKTREQFGNPLAQFQGIQFKIAEMAQQLHASKLLVWHAAQKKDEGAQRITLDAAIAKSYATESAQWIIDQALQIHGGVGLIRGSVTERLYRDIRALRIYEGSTEILKSLIASIYLKD